MTGGHTLEYLWSPKDNIAMRFDLAIDKLNCSAVADSHSRVLANVRV